MPNVRIPDDNSAIHDIGSFIMSYQPYQNAFLNALVNRIGRVLVTSQLWDDPWAVFKKGRLEYGETVEEIFVNIAEPHSYDPAVAEKELYKREIPDVRAAFHSMDYQKFYKCTVTNDQLRQAFLSYGELTDLIARIVDSLYTGMQLDEFLTMKYMVCREALNGGIYAVNTGTTGADIVKAFREYTNNLKFLKTLYNRAGVRNSTPIERQVIIVSNAVEAELGVEVLANAFNLSYVDYIGRRIAIDSFTFDSDDESRLAVLLKDYTPFTTAEKTALQTITGLKVDERWFMVFDNFEQFTENYNGQGLYWQYFLHAWKTFSVSPFHNAILFTTATTSVTAVTVSPATANLALGASLQMSASVTGSGFYDRAVTWSIGGQDSDGNDTELASGTNIDGSNGVLHVATDETVGNKIIVTAHAYNPDGSEAKTTSATITVIK